MRSRKSSIGLGRIAIYIAILALSAAIIIRIFYALYDVSRQNIIGTWRNNTREMAQEFSVYLTMPMDAVSFSAATINAMDIFLDGVQQIIEEITSDPNIKEAFVIDNEGYIVAHSDQDYLGTHLYDDGEDLDKKLYDAISNASEGYVDLASYNLPDIAFIENINDVWKTVVVLDKTSTFFSLRSIYVVTGLFLFSMTGVLLLLFAYISAKHRRTLELSNEVEAIADIYVSVLKIDMKKDSVKLIRSNEGMDKFLAEKMGNIYSDNCRKMAERMSSEMSKELLIRFMDASTLNERMQGVNSISQEFMDYQGRWIRIRFIAVEREDNDDLRLVLLAFESIDEDRKRQEKLKILSETDSMTGIRNRGSGESEIKQLLAEGRSGMFCLMDADNFKFSTDSLKILKVLISPNWAIEK